MSRPPNDKRLLLAFVLVCALLAVAIGAVSRTVYKSWAGDIFSDGEYADTLIVGVSVADTLNWLTPLRPKRTLQNENILLQVQFEHDSIDVGISVGLYHEYPEGTYRFVSVSDELTVVSSADWFVGDSPYVSIPEDRVVFPTLAAPIYDVRITTAPDSGNVWVWALPYGGNSPD